MNVKNYPLAMFARQLLAKARSSCAARPAAVRELHIGLPLLLKAAAFAKKAKIATSWGTMFASRSTGERAQKWRTLVRRLAIGSSGGLAVGLSLIHI